MQAKSRRAPPPSRARPLATTCGPRPWLSYASWSRLRWRRIALQCKVWYISGDRSAHTQTNVAVLLVCIFVCLCEHVCFMFVFMHVCCLTESCACVRMCCARILVTLVWRWSIVARSCLCVCSLVRARICCACRGMRAHMCMHLYDAGCSTEILCQPMVRFALVASSRCTRKRWVMWLCARRSRAKVRLRGTRLDYIELSAGGAARLHSWISLVSWGFLQQKPVRTCYMGYA